MKREITAAEAAKILKVTRRTVYNLLYSNDLRHRIVGEKTYLISLASVRKYALKPKRPGRPRTR